jgi:hypothetical protein
MIIYFSTPGLRVESAAGCRNCIREKPQNSIVGKNKQKNCFSISNVAEKEATKSKQ